MAGLQLVVIAVMQFTTSSVSSTYTAADATALQTALLSGYSSKVRPSARTVVDVTFGMMHITELNNVNQRLHVVGFSLASWSDARLSWNSSDYGDMNYTYMPLSDIWSPVLLLNNPADEIQIMNDDSDLSSVNVYLTNDGGVSWLAPANYIAQCTIDIMYYPLDTQQCSFVISSWIFIGSDLQIKSSSTSINLDLYQENGEWVLTKSTVQNRTRTLFGHVLPVVEFTTYLSRKYSYYLMNMILPVIVLAMMEPFVFLLPVDSGEKIGFTLTILLSLSVIMTIVSNSIPPTSTPVSLLSVYLLVTFIICAVETLLTVLTCRLHDFHLKNHTMGPKQQSITRILAKLTINSMVSEEDGKENITKHKKQKSSSVNPIKDDEQSKEDKKIGAWSNDDEMKICEKEKSKEFTFGEMVMLLDKFNFVLFLFLTILITAVFLIVLKTGGS